MAAPLSLNVTVKTLVTELMNCVPLEAAYEQYNDAITVIIDQKNKSPTHKWYLLRFVRLAFQNSLTPFVDIADTDPLKDAKNKYYKSITTMIDDQEKTIYQYLKKRESIIQKQSEEIHDSYNISDEFYDQLLNKHESILRGNRKRVQGRLNLTKIMHPIFIKKYNDALHAFIKNITETLPKKDERSAVGKDSLFPVSETLAKVGKDSLFPVSETLAKFVYFMSGLVGKKNAIDFLLLTYPFTVIHRYFQPPEYSSLGKERTVYLNDVLSNLQIHKETSPVVLVASQNKYEGLEEGQHDRITARLLSDEDETPNKDQPCLPSGTMFNKKAPDDGQSGSEDWEVVDKKGYEITSSSGTMFNKKGGDDGQSGSEDWEVVDKKDYEITLC